MHVEHILKKNIPNDITFYTLHIKFQDTVDVGAKLFVEADHVPRGGSSTLQVKESRQVK